MHMFSVLSFPTLNRHGKSQIKEPVSKLIHKSSTTKTLQKKRD